MVDTTSPSYESSADKAPAGKISPLHARNQTTGHIHQGKPPTLGPASSRPFVSPPPSSSTSGRPSVDEILSSTKSLHDRRSYGRPRRSLSQWQSHITNEGPVPPSSTRSRIKRDARKSESNFVGTLGPPPKRNAAKSSSSYAGAKISQKFERELQMQQEPMKQMTTLFDDSKACNDVCHTQEIHVKGKKARPLTKNVNEPSVFANETTVRRMEQFHYDTEPVLASNDASNFFSTGREFTNPGDETNHPKKALPQKSLESLISQVVAKYKQFTGKSVLPTTSSSAVELHENASPENILNFIPLILRIFLSTKSDPISRNLKHSIVQSDLEAKIRTESKSDKTAAVHISESEMADQESNFSLTLKSVPSVKYIVHNRPNTSEVAALVDPNEEKVDDDTRRNTSTTMSNEERIVREIQWQIWTRMMVWDAEGKVGLAFLDRLLVLKSEDDIEGEPEAVNIGEGKVGIFI